MSKSKYWLKMYHEALRDHKLALLPNNLWRRFWECCLMAGETNEGGFLPSVDEMSFTVRVDVGTLRAELGQLAQAGFVELKLDDNGDERWYVSNFQKRQEPSDAAKRMREYRKRKRKETKEKEEITDNRYTYNIPYRNERYEPVTKRNGTGDAYIHPDSDPIAELKTAMSQVTKTPMQFHEEEYDKAAYALLGWDASPDRVRNFSEWWDKNGYYKGKPALKSLVAEWTNYTDGVQVEQPESVSRSVKVSTR